MLRRVFQESAVVRSLTRVRRQVVTTAAASRLLGPIVTRFLSARRGDSPAQPSTGHPTDETTAGDSHTASGSFQTVRSLARESRLIAAGASTIATLGVATKHSHLTTGVTRTAQRYTKESWLYRWLTAEPDPDVIVIDLRETLTVGPWLAAVERGLRWLLPATATSALFGLTRRSHRLMTKRPVQVASLFVGAIAVGLLFTAGMSGTASGPLLIVTVGLAVLAILGSRVQWSWADLRESRGFQAVVAAFEPPEPPERVDASGEDDADDHRQQGSSQDSPADEN